MNNTNTMNLVKEEQDASHASHSVKMKSYEEIGKAIIYETKIDESGEFPFCNIYADPESVKESCKGIRIVLGMPVLISILVGYVDMNSVGIVKPVEPGMAEFFGNDILGSFIKDPDNDMMRFIDTADAVNDFMLLSQLKPIDVLMGRKPQLTIPMENPVNLLDLPPIEVSNSYYLCSEYMESFQNCLYQFANQKTVRVVYNWEEDAETDNVIAHVATCAYNDPQKIVAGTTVSWNGSIYGIFIKDPDNDTILRLIIATNKVSKKNLRRQLYRLENLVKCKENADL